MISPIEDGCVPARLDRGKTCRARLVSHRISQVLFCLGLLLFADVSAHAAIPQIVVIDSSAYQGATVTGTIDTGDFEYDTGNGVLVLTTTIGGLVDWYSDSSLQTLSGTGGWDGGMDITLSGHTVGVPQVVLYTNGSNYTLDGYDGDVYQPLCANWIGSDYVQAFSTDGNNNVVPNGYIFEFVENDGGSDVSPCYIYQSGPAPVTIDDTGGWPPDDALAYPATLSVDGHLMSNTSVDDGFNNGYYYSTAYYSDTSSTNDYLEFQASISGTDESGTLTGSVAGVSFNGSWNPSTNVFTSQTDLGIPLNAAGSPQYGPSMVTAFGDSLNFLCSASDGADVYYDFSTGNELLINSDDTYIAEGTFGTYSGSYDPTPNRSSGSFDVDHIAAVSADGTSILGVPPGVTLVTNGWAPTGIYSDNGGDPSTPPDYILHRLDGTALFKFTTYPTAAGDFFQIDSSPIYEYFGGEQTINAPTAYPPTNSPWIDILPQVYDFGNEWYITQDSLSYDFNGSFCSINYDYSSGSLFGAYTINLSDYNSPSLNNPGDGASCYGYGCPLTQDVNGNIYDISGTIDQYGDVFAACVGGYGPNPPEGTPLPPSGVRPLQGPPRVTWNGVSLSYSGTGAEQNSDLYTNPTSAEAVTINPDDSVNVSGSYTTTGSYDPANYQFSFGGNPNMTNIAAQDANGELLGTPAGLEVYSSSGGAGQSIFLGTGNFCTPTYTFVRPDGVCGVKFLNVPAGSVFLVQDANGNYGSPAYVYEQGTYQPGGGDDFSLDTTETGNWPASNLLPSVVYVNGVYTTIDGSTLALTGSGLNQGGSVAYEVQPSSLYGSSGNFTVAWYWNAGGFSAPVNGSYGAYSPFNGTYGGIYFQNLPAGLVISTSPPRPSPGYGPSEIDWNGVILTYNPIESSVSGTNRTGENVYQDTSGLDLSATIASGTSGAVTLTAANGTTFTGTYSGGTFTFSGQSPGTVTGIGSSGSSGNPPNGGTIALSSTVGGDLDIEGNFLTMGTWVTSGSDSVNALGISYTDTSGSNGAVLRFAGTRGALDWLWSEAAADDTNPQLSMMELDPQHRLILHDTTTDNGAGVRLDPTGPSDFAGSVLVGSGTAPVIVLPPSGPAHFKNAVLIAPQGDIEMGAYTTGTAP